jgi:hypothetical protein
MRMLTRAQPVEQKNRNQHKAYIRYGFMMHVSHVAQWHLPACADCANPSVVLTFGILACILHALSHSDRRLELLAASAALQPLLRTRDASRIPQLLLADQALLAGRPAF